MNNGWIKIHRKLLDWEWYDEPNTFRLFIHLLLKANHKPKNYRGVYIETGQVMTGQQLLSEQLGLSRMKIRKALDNLKTTNEITIKTNTKGSIIQIVMYNDYQVTTNNVTIEQPTNNQRTTTNKNEKKEEKEEIVFNFRKSLLEYGFNETLVNDWLIVRKKKRASNTETAFNGFIKQIESCDKPINDLLTECVNNSWSGFKKIWYDNLHPEAEDVVILPYPERIEFMVFIRDNCRIQKEDFEKHKKNLERKHDVFKREGWVDWKGNTITDWKSEALKNINHWIK